MPFFYVLVVGKSRVHMNAVKSNQLPSWFFGSNLISQELCLLPTSLLWFFSPRWVMYISLININVFKPHLWFIYYSLQIPPDFCCANYDTAFHIELLKILYRCLDIFLHVFQPLLGHWLSLCREVQHQKRLCHWVFAVAGLREFHFSHYSELPYLIECMLL